MRTTITIDETLLDDAKQRANRDGKSLSALIGEALRAELHHKPALNPRPFRLVTYGGGGLQAGVGLERPRDLLNDEDTRIFLGRLGRPGARNADDSSRRKRSRIRTSP